MRQSHRNTRGDAWGPATPLSAAGDRQRRLSSLLVAVTTGPRTKQTNRWRAPAWLFIGLPLWGVQGYLRGTKMLLQHRVQHVNRTRSWYVTGRVGQGVYQGGYSTPVIRRRRRRQGAVVLWLMLTRWPVVLRGLERSARKAANTYRSHCSSTCSTTLVSRREPAHPHTTAFDGECTVAHRYHADMPSPPHVRPVRPAPLPCPLSCQWRKRAAESGAIRRRERHSTRRTPSPQHSHGTGLLAAGVQFRRGHPAATPTSRVGAAGPPHLHHPVVPHAPVVSEAPHEDPQLRIGGHVQRRLWERKACQPRGATTSWREKHVPAAERKRGTS